MHVSNFPRQLIIWLACLALLFNAFLPSLAGSMGGGCSEVRNGVIEICSVQGVKLVDSATGKVLKVDALKTIQDKPRLHGHCAFCLPHTDHDFILPALAGAVKGKNLSEAFPSLFYQSPSTLFIWDSAQARAPPVLV